MKPTALILGSSGRFGCNMIQAFEAAGWAVRGFDRDHDDLNEAVKGVDAIVHGWNPPYDKWARDMPELTKKIIEAAQNTGATVLIPGNVYGYGPDAPENWTEQTPQHAQNPLARLRIEMEVSFSKSGAQVIIFRCGDFLDTEASGNWFDRVIVKPLKKGVIHYPGNPNIPHSWSYLPDYCKAFVMLAEKRAELPVFTAVNYEGYTLTGTEIAEILGGRVKQMRWEIFYLLAPFWKLARHFIEMRYLWNKPHRLDGTAFRKLLPDFQETPVETALLQAASFQIDPN